MKTKVMLGLTALSMLFSSAVMAVEKDDVVPAEVLQIDKAEFIGNNAISAVVNRLILSEGGKNTFSGLYPAALARGEVTPEMMKSANDIMTISLGGLQQIGKNTENIGQNTEHVNAESAQGLSDLLQNVDKKTADSIRSIVDTTKVDVSVPGTIANNDARSLNTTARGNMSVASYGNHTVGLPQAKRDVLMAIARENGMFERDVSLTAADIASKGGWRADGKNWEVNTPAGINTQTVGPTHSE
jgi:hypothetical protein